MNKKTVPSVSGGMTQGEAMQRVIALRKASGASAAPLNVAPWPPAYESLYDYWKRKFPGLTDEKIDEMLALIGG